MDAYTCVVGREDKRVYQLRYDVFARHLGWIPDSDDGLDIDRHDLYATPRTIYSHQDEPVACARIIRRPHVFMVETEFPELLHSPLPKDNVSEVSRLCLSPYLKEDRAFVSKLLLKIILHDTLMHNDSSCYFVTSSSIVRMLKGHGCPVTVISQSPLALFASINRDDLEID